MEEAEGLDGEPELRARDLFDRFTMGMVATLEACTHVVDVRSKPAVPCSAKDIAQWETKHTTKLPSDLRDFFLSSNGLQIIWTVLLDRQILPLGWLHVNDLHALQPLQFGTPTSAKPRAEAPTAKGRVKNKLPASVEEFLKNTSVADDSLTIKRRRYMPYKAFVLAPCGSHATVALVLTKPSPSVWLVDRSRTWHMIARTFTEYYRLMTLYLGLPEWQYALTSLGPLPGTRQWLHAFVPPHVLRDGAEAAESDPSTLADVHDITALTSATGSAASLFASESDMPHGAALHDTLNFNPNTNDSTATTSISTSTSTSTTSSPTAQAQSRREQRQHQHQHQHQRRGQTRLPTSPTPRHVRANSHRNRGLHTPASDTHHHSPNNSNNSNNKEGWHRRQQQQQQQPSNGLLFSPAQRQSAHLASASQTAGSGARRHQSNGDRTGDRTGDSAANGTSTQPAPMSRIDLDAVMRKIRGGTAATTATATATPTGAQSKAAPKSDSATTPSSRQKRVGSAVSRRLNDTTTRLSRPGTSTHRSALN